MPHRVRAKCWIIALLGSRPLLLGSILTNDIAIRINHGTAYRTSSVFCTRYCLGNNARNLMRHKSVTSYGGFRFEVKPSWLQLSYATNRTRQISDVVLQPII